MIKKDIRSKAIFVNCQHRDIYGCGLLKSEYLLAFQFYKKIIK